MSKSQESNNLYTYEILTTHEIPNKGLHENKGGL